jgi:adenylate cyclase class IV
MARNVEIKARAGNIENLERAVAKFSDTEVGEIIQDDTLMSGMRTSTRLKPEGGR